MSNSTWPVSELTEVTVATASTSSWLAPSEVTSQVTLAPTSAGSASGQLIANGALSSDSSRSLMEAARSFALIGSTVCSAVVHPAAHTIDESAKLRQVEKIIRMKLPVSADHMGEPDPVRPAGEKSAYVANDRGDQRRERKPFHRGQGPKPQGEHNGKGQQRPAHGFGHKHASAKAGETRYDAGGPAQGKPAKKRFRPKRAGFGNKPVRAA